MAHKEKEKKHPLKDEIKKIQASAQKLEDDAKAALQTAKTDVEKAAALVKQDAAEAAALALFAPLAVFIPVMKASLKKKGVNISNEKLPQVVGLYVKHVIQNEPVENGHLERTKRSTSHLENLEHLFGWSFPNIMHPFGKQYISPKTKGITYVHPKTGEIKYIHPKTGDISTIIPQGNSISENFEIFTNLKPLSPARILKLHLEHEELSGDDIAAIVSAAAQSSTSDNGNVGGSSGGGGSDGGGSNSSPYATPSAILASPIAASTSVQAATTPISTPISTPIVSPKISPVLNNPTINSSSDRVAPKPTVQTKTSTVSHATTLHPSQFRKATKHHLDFFKSIGYLENVDTGGGSTTPAISTGATSALASGNTSSLNVSQITTIVTQLINYLKGMVNKLEKKPLTPEEKEAVGGNPFDPNEARMAAAIPHTDSGFTHTPVVKETAWDKFLEDLGLKKKPVPVKLK